MELDLLERTTLRIVTIISFFVFFFLPLKLGMKILFSSLLIYFFVLFFLCSSWASDWHPERKFIIGFFIGAFHSFIFLLGGFIGLILAQIALKLYPFLLDYFRSIWVF
jgi:hypothetical protein